MTEPTQPKAGDRTLRGMLLGLAVILLLCGLYMAYRQTLRARIEAELNAVRSQGLPVTCVELDAWYPTPPAGRNAAEVYLDAHRGLWKAPEEINRLLPIAGMTNLPARTVALPDDLRAASERYLQENARALQSLEQAATFTTCRYPVDLRAGVATLLPHLSKTRECARLLAVEGMIAAEHDDAERAVRAIRTGTAVARSLDQEPVLISQLVRIACLAINISQLERTLNRVALDDQQLAAISAALAKAENVRTFRRAMAGELCFGESVFQSPLEGLFSGGGPGTTPSAELAIGYELYRLSGLLDLDHNRYVHTMRECVRVSSLPPTDQIKAIPSLDRAVEEIPWHCIVSRMLLPALSSAAQKDVEGTARLRVARTALAVERFRLARSQLPATLEELATLNLGPVPLDPFDGAPLRYKRLAVGFVVYSIGRNLTDDGGLEKDPSAPRGGRPPDIIFMIER